MSRFSIRAFVGPNGGGKTLGAIEQVVIPAWKRGRPVVANLSLDPVALGFDASLFRPLGSWREIADLRGVELILDEISSALPSRQAHSVPPELMRVLNQLRKGDVRCTWTAPDWGRADVALRQVTQAVTLCVGTFPDRWARRVPLEGAWRPPAIRYGDSDAPPVPETVEGVRPVKIGDRVEVGEGWWPNRLFTMTTYDAVSFDEFSLAATKKLKRESVQRLWRTKGKGMHAYSTLQAVDLLDHLDDVGTCVVCGGSRSRPKCSCKPGPPEGASAPAGGSVVRPAARLRGVG